MIVHDSQTHLCVTIAHAAQPVAPAGQYTPPKSVGNGNTFARNLQGRAEIQAGIVQLSDPSGQYEAILFQEGLTQYRDLLEKGACLLLNVQAQADGEDVRVRILAAEPLDDAAARIQKKWKLQSIKC